MNAARGRLLQDARTVLERVIVTIPPSDLADRAFVAWMLGRGNCPFDVDAVIAAVLERKTGSYRDVAALGYSAEVASHGCSFRQQLSDALSWLSKRPTTIAGEPAGFLTDSVALLGIALGASYCDKPEVEGAISAWVDRVLAARVNLPDLEPWERCLVAAAAQRLRKAHLAPLPSSQDTADCRIALRTRGVLPATHSAEMNAEEGSLVSLLLNEPLDGLGHVRAALRAAAFDAFKSQTEAAATIGTSNPGDMSMGKKKPAKKVFVSYAWESTEHQERVKQFTNKLRHDGLDATMDIFEPNPPEGLPQWMLNQIRRADFVLMVITETYRKRCEQDEESGKGKGVKWEGGIITRSLYNGCIPKECSCGRSLIFWWCMDLWPRRSNLGFRLQLKRHVR
jgi:SEFIR domain